MDNMEVTKEVVTVETEETTITVKKAHTPAAHTTNVLTESSATGTDTPSKQIQPSTTNKASAKTSKQSIPHKEKAISEQPSATGTHSGESSQNNPHKDKTTSKQVTSATSELAFTAPTPTVPRAEPHRTSHTAQFSSMTNLDGTSDENSRKVTEQYKIPKKSARSSRRDEEFFEPREELPVTSFRAESRRQDSHLGQDERGQPIERQPRRGERSASPSHRSDRHEGGRSRISNQQRDRDTREYGRSDYDQHDSRNAGNRDSNRRHVGDNFGTSSSNPFNYGVVDPRGQSGQYRGQYGGGGLSVSSENHGYDDRVPSGHQTDRETGSGRQAASYFTVPQFPLPNRGDNLPTTLTGGNTGSPRAGTGRNVGTTRADEEDPFGSASSNSRPASVRKIFPIPASKVKTFSAGVGGGFSNAPSTGVHRSFEPIYTHTAKCDSCSQNRRDVVQKCTICAFQMCKMCFDRGLNISMGNRHEEPVEGFDWTVPTKVNNKNKRPSALKPQEGSDQKRQKRVTYNLPGDHETSAEDMDIYHASPSRSSRPSHPPRNTPSRDFTPFGSNADLEEENTSEVQAAIAASLRNAGNTPHGSRYQSVSIAGPSGPPSLAKASLPREEELDIGGVNSLRDLIQILHRASEVELDHLDEQQLNLDRARAYRDDPILQTIVELEGDHEKAKVILDSAVLIMRVIRAREKAREGHA